MPARIVLTTIATPRTTSTTEKYVVITRLAGRP
jgi:hypothetical protein